VFRRAERRNEARRLDAELRQYGERMTVTTR
jgi:hypothetical protein